MILWWRAYSEAVDHPKLLLLSDKQHRAWFNLLCLASANEGALPDIKVIALKLRMPIAKVIALLAELKQAGLFDEIDGSTLPHNWSNRQFKSDGSTERVNRFRKRPGNVSSTVSETGPDYRLQTTERKKDAADAALPGLEEAPTPPPDNLERQLFDRGKQVLGKDAGGLISKLLKAKKADVALARAAIEQASTKQNPREYIGAVITGGHASVDGRRLTNDEQYWGVGRTPGII